MSSVERRPLHASTLRVPMAGCKPAPKHVLEPPDRCPRVPGRHCCFQTNPGSCAALPSHGWLCAGPSAKGWNSSCSVKSDKCLMSDRETTLTSHGSLPFNQSVVLQPSADTFLWGNVELFCTESFTLFVFCLIFSHHKEFFDHVTWSHHLIVLDIFWSRDHRFFSPIFYRVFLEKVLLK